MRGLKSLGVILVILGIVVLLMGHFDYSDTKPVLDAGPIHITAREDRSVSIPIIAGIAILLAGIGLIIIDRRAA